MSYNNPPPYTEETQKGFVPASTYQPPPQPSYQQPPYPQYTQPPYPQPVPQQSTVIIQTTGTSSVPLGSGPCRVTCPSCHAEVVTTVEHQATGTTHCWALCLCLVFWPCVCLPYCMDSCKEANHYCPNCRAYLGRV